MLPFGHRGKITGFVAQKLPGLWGPRSAGLCPEPAEAPPIGCFCRRGCVAALGVDVMSVLEGRPDLVGRWPSGEAGGQKKKSEERWSARIFMTGKAQSESAIYDKPCEALNTVGTHGNAAIAFL